MELKGVCRHLLQHGRLLQTPAFEVEEQAFVIDLWVNREPSRPGSTLGLYSGRIMKTNEPFDRKSQTITIQGL